MRSVPPGGRIDEDALHLIDSLTAPVEADLGAVAAVAAIGADDVFPPWGLDRRCASMLPICGVSWRAQVLMGQSIGYFLVNKWLRDGEKN